MKKMDVTRVSDEEVETLFTQQFDDRVAVYNNISEFEAKSQREVGKNYLTVEVMIVGSAGSPTIDDWKKGNVENADSIVIHREDIGALELQFVPEETLFLNANDYYVYYKSL